MKVRNIKIDGEIKTEEKSLLKFWERHARLTARFCSEIDCHECIDLKGSTVQKKDEETVYILPLCEKHSIPETEITVPHFMRFIALGKIELSKAL